MGCGCGKNKNKNKKSSRMPANVQTPKKIGNISVPPNMSPNQRRSTIAKINNEKVNYNRRKPNIADYLMKQRIENSQKDT
jgi:hypothetical protein